MLSHALVMPHKGTVNSHGAALVATYAFILLGRVLGEACLDHTGTLFSKACCKLLVKSSSYGYILLPDYIPSSVSAFFSSLVNGL
jgi:hypothetical protein